MLLTEPLACFRSVAVILLSECLISAHAWTAPAALASGPAVHGFRRTASLLRGAQDVAQAHAAGAPRLRGGFSSPRMGGDLLRVVGGVAVREGSVFMARRPEGKTHAGLWEFPGGKVEADESDEEALARELWEELRVKVSVGDMIAFGEDAKVRLFCYEVQMEGEPDLQEHSECSWIPLANLSTIPQEPADKADAMRRVPPADVATIQALMKKLNSDGGDKP